MCIKERVDVCVLREQSRCVYIRIVCVCVCVLKGLAGDGNNIYYLFLLTL